MPTIGPSPQGRSPGKRVPSEKEIGDRLGDFIESRGLKDMYGEAGDERNRRLKGPIKMGEEMAKKLIEGMGCTGEVAKDLTVLTLYDVAILIDDSTSMISEENGRRMEALVGFIDHITEIYSMANESGVLTIRFMNRAGGRRNWTGKSREYLNHHIYGGVTRIGTALKKRILDKFVTGNLDQRKPLLVLIASDGGVEGERKGHLWNVIRGCLKECEDGNKSNAVALQFSCIGNGPGATQLLKGLNEEDPNRETCVDGFLVGSGLESQLADKWFVLPKILLGAILPSWREQDDEDLLE